MENDRYMVLNHTLYCTHCKHVNSRFLITIHIYTFTRFGRWFSNSTCLWVYMYSHYCAHCSLINMTNGTILVGLLIRIPAALTMASPAPEPPSLTESGNVSATRNPSRQNSSTTHSSGICSEPLTSTAEDLRVMSLPIDMSVVRAILGNWWGWP